jgi:hypothetical protein
LSGPLSLIQGTRRGRLQRQRVHGNTALEQRGHICVYARERPTLAFEAESGAAAAGGFPEADQLSVTTSKKMARASEFDCVFRPGVSNDDVYKQVEPLIQSAAEVYNVCIFAYGHTRSGKSFTVEGNESSRGINYRALETVCAARLAGGRRRVRHAVSMLETYTESIIDTLAVKAPGDALGKGGGASSKLVPREGPQGMYRRTLSCVSWAALTRCCGLCGQATVGLPHAHHVCHQHG